MIWKSEYGPILRKLYSMEKITSRFALLHSSDPCDTVYALMTLANDTRLPVDFQLTPQVLFEKSSRLLEFKPSILTGTSTSYCDLGHLWWQIFLDARISFHPYFAAPEAKSMNTDSVILSGSRIERVNADSLTKLLGNHYTLQEVKYHLRNPKPPSETW